ncbi:glycerol dehydrogenase [Cupriavidus necator]|nr:glycerol dehydrogenase [Cupriavidus necator]
MLRMMGFPTSRVIVLYDEAHRVAGAEFRRKP